MVFNSIQGRVTVLSQNSVSAGHMAVRFGKALGLEVTVISTSENKRKTAKTLGADHFVVSKDEKAMLVSPQALLRNMTFHG